MNCIRCQGFICQRWDVELRQWEQACLHCGHRPDHPRRRVDGQQLGAPLLCRKCKVRPRMTTRLGQGGLDIELEHCVVCRVDELTYRRIIDSKRRKRYGNVRAFARQF
jgi:hypothetical protein